MKNFSAQLKRVEKEQEEIKKQAMTGQFEATAELKQKSDQILQNVQQKMASQIAQSEGSVLEGDLKNQVNEAIAREAEAMGLSYMETQQVQSIAVSSTGMGPLDALLNDPDVTEIIAQRYDNILYEKKGIMSKYEGRFNSEEHMQTIISKLIQPTGKVLNVSNPIVDAAWEDGSRINATIPPVSPKGATLSIRKFNDKAFTEQDYINFGTVDKRMIKFLEACVKAKVSIFISGGTGTGKTTFINMLSNFIPHNELVVTIEDTPELKLESPNIRSLVTRESKNVEMMNVDIARLVKNALRMRPDRIIVGEIRGGEIVDMLSAMSTGHEGSMATVHANSAQNLVNSRYPILYGKNPDMKVPVNVQNIQFSEAVQLIVQLKRFPKGTDKIKKGSRKVVSITAVDGVDDKGQIVLKDIYRFDVKNNRFYATGYYPKQIMDILDSQSISFDEDMFPAESDIQNDIEYVHSDIDISDEINLLGNINKKSAQVQPYAEPQQSTQPVKCSDMISVNIPVVQKQATTDNTHNIQTDTSDITKKLAEHNTGIPEGKHPVADEENYD